VFKSSSLSEDQREAAVALFEAGWGDRAVANRLGVGRKPIGRLRDRWRVRGGSTLVHKPAKRVFAFEFKLDVVRRYLAGENRVALAKELGLSSPELIRKWTQLYRDQGEDGLRPRPKGRPKESPGAAGNPESELQRLRRENERLRAEVAFLGKVQALRDEERR
jgi:transposase